MHMYIWKEKVQIGMNFALGVGWVNVTWSRQGQEHMPTSVPAVPGKDGCMTTKDNKSTKGAAEYLTLAEVIR